MICPRCEQWNLAPLDTRWEAIEDCKRLAATAESRVDATGLGIARTAGGLTLLIATGVSRTDIANWRYGRRLTHRRYILWWIATASALLILALGWLVGVEAGSGVVGFTVLAFGVIWFRQLWAKPPRPWVRVRRARVRPALVWGWQLHAIRFAPPKRDSPPVLLVPDGRGESRLTGHAAARFLAEFLPQVNGVDCLDASIAGAVERVDRAERGAASFGLSRRSRRRQAARKLRRKRSESHDSPIAAVTSPAPEKMRPWEKLADSADGRPVLSLAPELRLALEMAVTEEMERLALAEDAIASTDGWVQEEEIGAIADDLTVPDWVQERIDAMKRPRS
ncbi:MAG: hypothetical protein IT357_16020 [Gemmatimonadaceae bacterium]|nr:hypothetical protein [Gemmatimonadaceae bacterium]